MKSAPQFWTPGFLAALLALAGSTAAGEPRPSPDQWRNDNACGVNCLYVLLKLHDIKVTYGDLFDNMLRAGRETSLLDIQRAGAEYGLRYEAGRSTPEGLQSAKKAVICHTENPITGKGHFVLVLRADADGVLTMDGTTCVLRQSDWTTFRATWSGFVLFPKESRFLTTTEIATFVVSFGMTLGCLTLVPRLRRRSR